MLSTEAIFQFQLGNYCYYIKIGEKHNYYYKVELRQSRMMSFKRIKRDEYFIAQKEANKITPQVIQEEEQEQLAPAPQEEEQEQEEQEEEGFFSKKWI